MSNSNYNIRSSSIQARPNPLLDINKRGISPNLFPGQKSKLTPNIFATEIPSDQVMPQIQIMRNSETCLNNQEKKKVILDRELSRTHKISKVSLNGRANITLYNQNENGNSVSSVSKISKGNSKNFNHMTQKNLRKIEKLLKNKPILNDKFKYGKEKPNTNHCNSLGYWKKRKTIHDKRQRLIKRSKGLDKNREKEFTFGMNLRQSSVARRNRNLSFNQLRSHSSLANLVQEAQLENNDSLNVSGDFDESKMSELGRNSDFKEFTVSKRRSIKGIQPDFSNLFSVNNIFYPNKKRRTIKKNYLKNFYKYGGGIQQKNNPLFMTYNDYHSKQNHNTSYAKQRPVKSQLQHRKSKSIKNIKNPQVPRINIHKASQDKVNEYERSMESRRRQQSLDKVSHLGSPRVSLDSDRNRTNEHPHQRKNYKNLTSQFPFNTNTKFYEKIHTQNFFQPKRKQQNSNLGSKIRSNSASASKNKKQNPLNFKYTDNSHISKKITGILKNTDNTPSLLNSNRSQGSIQNETQKKKKGVVFNSKIQLENGFEKLKEEGQFKKPSRRSKK